MLRWENCGDASVATEAILHRLMVSPETCTLSDPQDIQLGFCRADAWSCPICQGGARHLGVRRKPRQWQVRRVLSTCLSHEVHAAWMPQVINHLTCPAGCGRAREGPHPVGRSGFPLFPDRQHLAGPVQETDVHFLRSVWPPLARLSMTSQRRLLLSFIYGQMVQAVGEPPLLESERL